MTLVVAIGMAVGIVPMLFNDYDDKMQKRVMADLAARRAAKINP
jgi:Na+/melibiose symporter-like transporter